MGKYGIGARVRDEDGDEGVIVDKRKGERRVRFEWDDSPSVTMWLAKSELTPVEAANDNAAAAEQWVPKVGDRVRYEDANTSGYGVVVAASPEEYYDWTVRPDEADLYFYDDERFGFKTRHFRASDLTLAPLTIEAGRYYKTRDGRKVGPMQRHREHEDVRFPWSAPQEFVTYRDDGSHLFWGGEDDLDLIAEWADEPVVAVEEVAVAEATPTEREFKVGDRVRVLRSPWYDYHVGSLATITVVLSDFHPASYNAAVDAGGDDFGWYFEGDDLELIEPATKFKAGDRVRRIASQVPAVCPVGFETNITKVDGQLIWYIDVDGDETSSTAGHGVWELIEPAAPTETPAAKFKVGDKVVVKADSDRDIATVRTRNAGGKMSISFDELGGEPGIEWWSDDELKLVTDEPKSDTITLTLKVDSEPLADAFRTIAAALNRAADDISAA